MSDIPAPDGVDELVWRHRYHLNLLALRGPVYRLADGSWVGPALLSDGIGPLGYGADRDVEALIGHGYIEHVIGDDEGPGEQHALTAKGMAAYRTLEEAAS